MPSFHNLLFGIDWSSLLTVCCCFVYETGTFKIVCNGNETLVDFRVCVSIKFFCRFILENYRLLLVHKSLV